jgi:transposase-like protein
VRTALQEVLEAEMTEALSAEKGERTIGRQGYQSGYHGRTAARRLQRWPAASLDRGCAPRHPELGSGR